MVAFFEMLKVPTILFMCVVAPIWIVHHYRGRKRDAAHLGAEEQAGLDQLTRIAERMEDRIVALERILDAEDPRWKDRQQ
jgi:phage shock protein B